MPLSAAITAPPKCLLVNVTSNESQSVLFNPAQLVERVSVNWNRLGVLGLSYQPLQYQNTSNRQLPGVEFYLDKFFAAEAPGDPDIDDFRSFLRALTVPPASADMAAPPRVLILWPKVLTIETIITELEFQYRVFGSDASTLIYTATCGFEGDPRRARHERRPKGRRLMPLQVGSRYSFCLALTDPEGRMYSHGTRALRLCRSGGQPHARGGLERLSLLARWEVLRAPAAGVRLLVGHRRLPARPHRGPDPRARHRAAPLHPLDAGRHRRDLG